MSFSPLAEALREDFSAVENAMRYTAVSADFIVNETPFRSATVIADAQLFEMFDFEFAHEWLEEELDTLDEQVRLGNEESIRFKAYADSLDLRARLAQMPRTALPSGWDMFCGAKDRLR